VSAALSPAVQAALSVLDQPGVLDPGLRLVVTSGNQPVVIELEAGVWRILDQEAALCGLLPEAFCRQALAAAPDTDPGDAVARFLVEILRERAKLCITPH
jgi:hypothetical protein